MVPRPQLETRVPRRHCFLRCRVFNVGDFYPVSVDQSEEIHVPKTRTSFVDLLIEIFGVNSLLHPPTRRAPSLPCVFSLRTILLLRHFLYPVTFLVSPLLFVPFLRTFPTLPPKFLSLRQSPSFCLQSSVRREKDPLDRPFLRLRSCCAPSTPHFFSNTRWVREEDIHHTGK